MERNTAWNNGDVGFNFRSSSSTLENNIAAVNKGTTQVTLVETVKASGNSWQSGSWSNSTFESVDYSALKGARGADGKVPASDFLIPKSGAAIGAVIGADV
ncbi:hypothetical protein M3J09_007268 [Ascochyta lentis]